MKDQDDVQELVEYANRACRLYQQQGSPEAAAGALDKTGKMIESKNPAAAINLYQHAVEVLMVWRVRCPTQNHYLTFVCFFLNANRLKIQHRDMLLSNYRKCPVFKCALKGNAMNLKNLNKLLHGMLILREQIW